MKNRKLLAAAIKISLACALVLSLPACKGKGDSVKIQSLPDRCVYYVGETPDISGATLSVTKDGKIETVTVTEEMLGSEKDTVFTREGKTSITITYNNIPVTVEIFVEDDLESHKTYAISSFSSWAEENILDDSVTDAVLKSAKEGILNAENHRAVASTLENAKKLALDYTNKIKAENALLFAKQETLKKLDDFDFSPFSQDHAEDIRSYISSSVTLVENASSPEEVNSHYRAFISKTDALKSDSHNTVISEFEKSFKEKYEANRIYYDDAEYELLLASLIKAERDIRECNTDEQASAVIKEFSEQIAPKFNTIPDIIYKKLSLLSADSLKYGSEITAIDEIAEKILTLILKSENGNTQFLKDKTGKTAIYALISAENKDELEYYPALANYESEEGKINLVSETEFLYRAYERLEEANKAAKAVIDAIDAIGDVRLDSESKISNARKAYSEWSKKYSIRYDSVNASMISNYQTLMDAEEIMEKLPEKASKAAERVRNEIKELIAKAIIYSDTDLGVGDDIESAYNAYDKWIATYGSFADTYINDGTNYKLKLDSYNYEYQQIEKMAKEIQLKTEELRTLISKINYSNYEPFSSQVDTAYKNLTSLHTSFKNTNGHITDKVSEYDALANEILYAKFKAHSDHYCSLLESEFNGYFEKISTDLSFRTQRDNLKTAFDKAKTSIPSVFSYDKALSENLSELEDGFELESERLKAIYTSYCYDYEAFSANEKLVELSKSYNDISFIQRRDAIIEDAQTEISELSRNTSLESYKESLAEIVEFAKTALKNAFGS